MRWPGGKECAIALSSTVTATVLAGYERRGRLVALAVRQVEHAARDERRRPVGRDVAQPYGEQCLRLIGADGEPRARDAEDLDPLGQRLRVEDERAPVLSALLERDVHAPAEAQPVAGVDAALERARDRDASPAAAPGSSPSAPASARASAARRSTGGHSASPTQRPGRSSAGSASARTDSCIQARSAGSSMHACRARP